MYAPIEEKNHRGFPKNRSVTVKRIAARKALSGESEPDREKMTRQGRPFALGILMISILITWLHYSTLPEIHAQHDIYREFYYIPIFLGALAFGMKGAALSYLLVFALYLPYIFISWTGNFTSEANKFLHLLLQGILALSAGYLIDRDRKTRVQLEKEQYLAGIGRAATAIVHDLRNPLLTVLGFARRIQDGKGKQDANVRVIIDSAHSMESIVNDVLDFARPIRLELGEEDLRQIVGHACEICRTRSEEAGVQVSRDLPGAPVIAVIDRYQIERVIANLLSNAIEASSKGQSITVSAGISGDNVVLRIKDQGQGMDKETLQNIFIPFYTKKSKGTGLGMSISQKIVEGHHGTMQIYSQPGKGTEVKIEFPRAV